MRYLLDVNALIALAHTGHALHAKAIGWYRSVLSSATGFHTCSITELGFVRVAAVTGLQPDIKGVSGGGNVDENRQFENPVPLTHSAKIDPWLRPKG